MKSTAITPLPSALNGLSRERMQAMYEERADRIRELEAKQDPNDLEEMRDLKREAYRLNQEMPNPHPGHPVARGGLKPQELSGALVKQLGGSGGLQAAFDGTSGGATLPFSFFDSNLKPLLQRRLMIRDLIPTVGVETDKVGYVQQTVFTNNAAPVSSGALKPTSVITAARQETPIATVAHVSEAVDRNLLADYDQLSQLIDVQLRLGVTLQEEVQILNGSGTAPNLRGILNTSGIQTEAKGTDATPDAILKAITKIRVANAEPDAIVMHPNDWQDIATLRTADGIYIWGSPADDTEPKIWGKQIAVTTAMTEGTALVGAFKTAATVYQRDGARVTFTESGLGDSAGQELFTRNELRFRGESRIGLAVFYPSLFCSVTGI